MKLLVWFFSISAIVAAGAFAFVLMRLDLALVSAVALLAAAQLVAVIVLREPHEADDARLTGVAQRISKNATDIENLSRRHKDQAQRLAELGQIVSPGTASRHPSGNVNIEPPAEAVLPPVPNFEPVMRSERQPHPIPHSPPHPQLAASHTAAAPQLCLEPVVRLSEGRTAYYKASFQAASSTAPSGVQTIVSSDIASGAVQGGAWNPALDMNMLQQVLPLLQKLRARRGATGVFCPVSAATLEDMNALQGYVGLLQANPDAAAGVVLDLHHTGLAGLGEAGMRGLAWLASLGATFCLTSDKLQVSDLPALSELGFAFIDVPASVLMRAQHAGQISPAISLVQSAADSNIAIIASAMVHAADTTQLMNMSSLGRGEGFAPPRAVRDPAHDTSSGARVA